MKIEKDTLLQERYRIEGLIGEGGMSYVYKAKDIKLGRIVALKVLKDEFAGDAEFVNKFQNEAKAAAKLNHLNIVSTFDTVDEGDLHFIVMELVEGITLKNFIQRKGKIAEREAIGIALQLIDGIDLAHKMGIVHRDIKPQNIIVSTEGVVKIADFGIARAASQETVNTAVMGSVHYISPEQARLGVSDARSDIYSFSCTLYEMLTGKVPYAGENSMAVVFSHLEDPIPRVRDSVKEISKALDYIVWRGMQKKASLRYQSIADMGEDFRLALEDPDGSFLSEREDDGGKGVFGRNGLDQGISNLYKGLAIASVILIVGVFLFLGYKVVGLLRSVQSISSDETKLTEKTTEDSTQVAITISALDSLLPGIIGTMQAAEALKLIIGGAEPLLGRLALLDVWGGRLREIPVAKNPACPVCGENPTITALVTEADSCTIPQTPGADAQPHARTAEDDSHRQSEGSRPDSSASPRIQGTGEAPTAESAADTVSAAELRQLLAGAEPPALLDVREEIEVTLEPMEGALHIPLREVVARMDELDVACTTVVVCAAGIRSARAIEALRAAGYTGRLVNLDGGVKAWAAG